MQTLCGRQLTVFVHGGSNLSTSPRWDVPVVTVIRTSLPVLFNQTEKVQHHDC